VTLVNDFLYLSGMMAVFALSGMPLALLSFAIPYALLRLQDSREENHDPQVGLKAVLYFVFSLGVLILLTGLNILLYDFIQDHNPGGFGRPAATTSFRPAQRYGVALVVVGIAVCLGHLLLILAYTNDLRRPGTRRMFVGYRLAILAVVTLGAFTMLVVMLFQENIKLEDLKLPFSVLAVWGVAWLIHLLLLRFASRPGRPIDIRERSFRLDE
jgi:hypothetical protein